MSNGLAADILGPIRPAHATGGWRLEGDDQGGWWLSKPAEDGNIARIQATGATTCSWGIYRPDVAMVREASSTDVEAAKWCADQWIAGHR